MRVSLSKKSGIRTLEGCRAYARTGSKRENGAMYGLQPCQFALVSNGRERAILANQWCHLKPQHELRLHSFMYFGDGRSVKYTIERQHEKGPISSRGKTRSLRVKT
jgi:hypothetical protein